MKPEIEASDAETSLGSIRVRAAGAQPIQVAIEQRLAWIDLLRAAINAAPLR